jgi:hypothetical protein
LALGRDLELGRFGFGQGDGEREKGTGHLRGWARPGSAQAVLFFFMRFVNCRNVLILVIFIGICRSLLNS